MVNLLSSTDDFKAESSLHLHHGQALTARRRVSASIQCQQGVGGRSVTKLAQYHCYPLALHNLRSNCRVGNDTFESKLTFLNEKVFALPDGCSVLWLRDANVEVSLLCSWRRVVTFLCLIYAVHR